MIFYLSIITILLTASAAYNNYPSNKNTLYLSAYLLILSLYTLVHYLVFDGDSVVAIAIFFKHVSPLFYLPGAMLFLYVRGILIPYKLFSTKDLWHFIPFAIGLLNITPYIFSPFASKLELANNIYRYSNFSKLYDAYLFYPFYISSFIRSGLFMYYTAACIYLLLEHKKKQDNDIIPTEIRNQFRWLQFITGTGLVLSLCITIISITFYIYKDVGREEIDTHYFAITAGGCFILIPLVMLFFPEWVSDYRTVIKTSTKKFENNKEAQFKKK